MAQVVLKYFCAVELDYMGLLLLCITFILKISENVGWVVCEVGYGN